MDNIQDVTTNLVSKQVHGLGGSYNLVHAHLETTETDTAQLFVSNVCDTATCGVKDDVVVVQRQVRGFYHEWGAGGSTIHHLELVLQDEHVTHLPHILLESLFPLWVEEIVCGGDELRIDQFLIRCWVLVSVQEDAILVEYAFELELVLTSSKLDDLVYHFWILICGLTEHVSESLLECKPDLVHF